MEQAVILCGGLGTRLRPLTDKTPKSMMPIGSRPFLELLVLHFKKQGINKFVFCSGHLHEQVEAHFGEGGKLGVHIIHSVEPEPLGTGGALLIAKPYLDRQFFVAYGDSLLNVNVLSLASIFKNNNALGVITAYDNHEKIAENNVRLDDSGRVLAYDKMKTAPGMNAVEAGVSLLDRSVLELAEGKKFSLETDIFPKLINNGRLFGLLTPQRFYDIGTPEGLELAEVMLNDLG